jgi:hypothetical protein
MPNSPFDAVYVQLPVVRMFPEVRLRISPQLQMVHSRIFLYRNKRRSSLCITTSGIDFDVARNTDYSAVTGSHFLTPIVLLAYAFVVQSWISPTPCYV